MGDEQTAGYESPEYKIYIQETNSYTQEKLEIFKLVPTFYVSLSTFMFGGSVWAMTAFVKPHETWLLKSTWVGLAVALSLMLIELLCSLRAYERAVDIAGERLKSKDYVKNHPNGWADWCVRLQIVASIAFVIGIFSFLSFFCYNIDTPRSSDVSQKAPDANANPATQPVKDVKRPEEPNHPPASAPANPKTEVAPKK